MLIEEGKISSIDHNFTSEKVDLRVVHPILVTSEFLRRSVRPVMWVT